MTRKLPRSLLIAIPLVAVLARSNFDDTAPAPQATGPHHECSACHHSRASLSSAVVTAVSGTDAASVCRDCHGDLLHAAPFTRVAGGHSDFSCLTCHDAHASGDSHQLRRTLIVRSEAGPSFDSATRVCVSCHFAAGQFKGLGGGFVRHPVGIPVGRHDARVVPAGVMTASATWSEKRAGITLPLVAVEASERGPSQTIGCTTCHFAHGTANPYMLRWSAAEEPAACLMCHPSVVEPVAATP